MSGYAELKDDELASIFSEFIEPRYQHVESSDSPTLFMVGGQPGAGKSKALHSIKWIHRDAVAVIGDDLRVYHPDYAYMLEHEPLRMPEETRRASGTWVRMSLDYLKDRHSSVIVETTFAHPAANEDTIRSFKQAGYRIVIIVVTVPAVLSLLGIVDRYIRQYEQEGYARWTDPAYHDAVVAQLPDSVEQLINTGLVDEIQVVDRESSILLSSTMNGMALHSDLASYASAVVSERLRADSLNEKRREDARLILHMLEEKLQHLSDIDEEVIRTVQRLHGLLYS